MHTDRPLIGYCTNIHPGESWADTFANLQTKVTAVRDGHRRRDLKQTIKQVGITRHRQVQVITNLASRRRFLLNEVAPMPRAKLKARGLHLRM